MFCLDNLATIYSHLSSTDALNFSMVSKAWRGVFWYCESSQRDRIFINFPDVERIKLHSNIIKPPFELLLINAAKNNRLDIVKHLIKRGVNPCAHRDRALCYASLNGHVKAVKMLIKAGANIEENGDEALYLACEENCLSVVKILIAAGVDPSADSSHAAALASMCGHLDLVKYLVTVPGIDKNRRAKPADFRNNSLGWACEYGDLKMVKYLISLGANPVADFNYAVEAAYDNGHMGVVEYLLTLPGVTLM